MSHRHFNLGWIIAPIECDSFIQSYWCKKPLRVQRNDASYYASLLPEESLEYAFQVASRLPGALEELSDDQYPRRIRTYEAVRDSLAENKSLRIDAIQRFSRELSGLCRILERELSCPINVNMYFSPASSRALKQHFDTHDVFVLQLYGQKRWQLFNPIAPFPLEYVPPLRCELSRGGKYRRDKNKLLASEPTFSLTDEFTLKSGDLLYLPRGHWHVAEAEPGNFSCHLTVGAQSFTYLDLMTIAITQAAARDVRFREPLPLEFGSDSSHAAVRDRVNNLIKTLPEHVDPDAALNEVAEVFVRSRFPGPLGLFKPNDPTTMAQIGLDSVVGLRKGTMCVVSADQSNVLLKFDSRVVSMPLRFEEACHFIDKERRFTPRQVPGNITDDDKLSLVRRLVGEGIVTESRWEIAGPGEPRTGLAGWLPVNIRTHFGRPQIDWVYFGRERLSEPMFFQTVARLKKAHSPLSTRATGLRALTQFSDGIRPSGFIFHVSRCGSTLVSNALRAAPGTVVLSEAQPFGALLNLVATQSDERNLNSHPIFKDLLKGLAFAFGQRRCGDEKTLIIKFSSWHILAVDTIRQIWPEVPCLIVIREPVEVMVSCLQKPPGWMQFKNAPSRARRVFGWNQEAITAMSSEEFCARGIAQFASAALRQTDSRCRVVDYQNINASNIRDIMIFFGLDAEHVDQTIIDRCFATYSKDNTEMFVPDRVSKQTAATEAIQRECKQWAAEPYALLRTYEESARKARLGDI